MRVLLDTHTVLWLSLDPAAVDPEVLGLLASPATDMLLSAVVPWEVAITYAAAKLPLPEHPRAWVARLARGFGTVPLPVLVEHVVGVADLPDHHRDPFDRLLIAQARAEGVPIVTADEAFTRYDVEVLRAR